MVYPCFVWKQAGSVNVIRSGLIYLLPFSICRPGWSWGSGGRCDETLRWQPYTLKCLVMNILAKVLSGGGGGERERDRQTDRQRTRCTSSFVNIASVVMIWLVSWCFEPSQPQKDYMRAEHKRHSISKLFISQVIVPKVMFFSLFIFRGHSTREPASGKVTYFILRAYTGTMC